MNKEEFDMNQELEQMRQDYAALKEQLDGQQIISDHLLQSAMKRDVRWLFLEKKIIIWESALIVALIALSIALNTQWWLTTLLAVFGIIVYAAIPVVYKGVREENICNGDILSTAQTLLRFKKRYIAWELGMCVYFLVFAILASYHMTTMGMGAEMMWRRGILVVIVVVVVLVLEYAYAKRLLGSCDAIIERLQMKGNTSRMV